MRLNSGAVSCRTIPSAVAPVAPAGARLAAEHLDLAGGGIAEALEHLDGRGLPGAVGAEEGEDPAARHLEVDAADGLDVAVRDAQPADADGRRGLGEGARGREGSGLGEHASMLRRRRAVHIGARIEPAPPRG